MWQAYAALAGYQIISGLQQADAIRQNAELSKEISDMNAEYAEVDAYNAELEGYTKSARYQTNVDETVSAQRTAYAAQNVDVNFGTAKEVQQETKLIGYLNQLDIISEAHQAAAGYKNQARNTRLQGIMGGIQSEANATATKNAALMGAAQTGLSGYAKYKGV